jgi:hypothetical protein
MTDLGAAYHEAAHCIVARRLGLRLRRARIEQDGSGSTTTMVRHVDADDPYWVELQIIVSMAGTAAEVVLLGRSREDVPDASDRADQRRRAEALAPARQRDWEMRCWQCACAYVRQFAYEIESLADELINERQLSGFALTRTIERAEHQDRRRDHNV